MSSPVAPPRKAQQKATGVAASPSSSLSSPGGGGGSVEALSAQVANLAMQPASGAVNSSSARASTAKGKELEYDHAARLPWASAGVGPAALSNLVQYDFVDLPETALVDPASLDDRVLCINAEPTFPVDPASATALLACPTVRTLRLDVHNAGRKAIVETTVDLPKLTSLIWFGRSNHDLAKNGYDPDASTDGPPRFVGGIPWLMALASVITGAPKLERLHICQMNPTCNGAGESLTDIVHVLGMLKRSNEIKSMHLEGWDGDAATYAKFSMLEYGELLSRVAPRLQKFRVEIPSSECSDIAKLFAPLTELQVVWIRWNRAEKALTPQEGMRAVTELAKTCKKLRMVRLSTYIPATERGGKLEPETHFYTATNVGGPFVLEPLTAKDKESKRWIRLEPFFIDAWEMTEVPFE